MPGSRREYWEPKLARNRERDTRNLEALRASGWRCLVVWECETKSLDGLANILKKFLEE